MSMYSLKSLTLLLAISLSPIATLIAEDTHSNITYSLDKEHGWKVGYEAKNKDMSITEYIPQDQTAENWKDLFTVHHYFGIDIEVAKYYDAFIKELEKMAPGSKVESKLINQDKNSLFGEWWINDTTPNAQHEWFRVFADGKDVVVLRFTTKRLGDVETMRKSVEDMLNNAQFTKGELTIKPEVEKANEATPSEVTPAPEPAVTPK